MSTLLVVRHGQASFGAADYDVLSPLGVKQSRRLGEWLAHRGTPIDALWCGPLRRQRDTARHLAEAAARCGLALPAPEILEDLREVSGGPETHRIFAALDARLRAGELLAEDQTSPMPADAGLREAQEIIMRAWAGGRVQLGEMESYAALQERSRRAFRQLLDTVEAGRRVVAVTSAGPLGIALSWAMDMPPVRAVATNMRAVNAGLSEFRVDGPALRLLSYNASGHLAPDEVTTV